MIKQFGFLNFTYLSTVNLAKVLFLPRFKDCNRGVASLPHRIIAIASVHF